MNELIRDIPKQVEKMRKESKDSMMQSMIAYITFQREMKRRGIETHGEAMARRQGKPRGKVKGQK